MYILSSKKISLVSGIFQIIQICNFNKINVGNPHITFFQPLSNLSDINRYLQFNNDIKFGIISDNKNTSNQYESHEKLVCKSQICLSLNYLEIIEVRNSRARKSSDKTNIRKMTSHFQLITGTFL